MDATWYSKHVRESQYCLQIVKCSIDCCGVQRSDIKLILKDGFLPLSVPIVQDPDTGRLRVLNASEKLQGAQFLGLFQSMSIHLRNSTSRETLPYDFACPTIQDDVEPGRRICKNCRLYFASIRRSLRIAAKILKRGKGVLCRTIHSSTGAEDVLWLEKSEVPTEVPEEDLTSVPSNDLPMVSDWAAWLASLFSPEDSETDEIDFI